jgi:glycerol-3-phosphate dehydrogenase
VDVVALGERVGLLQALGPDTDHLAVEVAWAAREELALGVADVMVRRTRLAQELPDRGASIAPRVAEILGAELGWTKRRRQDEVAGFLARAHHDFDVPPGGGTVV